jgi:hypothetical protein
MRCRSTPCLISLLGTIRPFPPDWPGHVGRFTPPAGNSTPSSRDLMMYMLTVCNLLARLRNHHIRARGRVRLSSWAGVLATGAVEFRGGPFGGPREPDHRTSERGITRCRRRSPCSWRRRSSRARGHGSGRRSMPCRAPRGSLAALLSAVPDPPPVPVRSEFVAIAGVGVVRGNDLDARRGTRAISGSGRPSLLGKDLGAVDSSRRRILPAGFDR